MLSKYILGLYTSYLYPIVIYLKVNNNLVVKSTCIISNHLLHNTSAVHSFLNVVLGYIMSYFKRYRTYNLF